MNKLSDGELEVCKRIHASLDGVLHEQCNAGVPCVLCTLHNTVCVKAYELYKELGKIISDNES